MKNWKSALLVGVIVGVLGLGYGVGLLSLNGCASEQVPLVETIGSEMVSTPLGKGNGEEKYLAPEMASSQQDRSSETGDTIFLSASFDGWQQRVIKNAVMALEVEKGKLQEIASRVELLAETRGGFIKSSQFSSWEGGQQALIAIAVPANAFSSTLAAVQNLGTVLSSQTSGQDVTQEYHDLEMDLGHWEAERISVMLLLEKAQTLEDILTVRQFLEPIERQINEIKGRLEYLKQSSDYSTIQVSLQEAGVVGQTVDGPSFWDKIGDIFQTSISGLLVVFAAALPWVVVLGIVAVIVMIVVRRRRRKVSGVPPVTPPSPPKTQ